MTANTSKTRKIGNDDVNPIGYGAMGIAAVYGSVPPDEERLKVHKLRDHMTSGTGLSSDHLRRISGLRHTLCSRLQALGHLRYIRRF